jgi:radical SAM superfamily enzyme YgiQ (UPF0313 family)
LIDTRGVIAIAMRPLVAAWHGISASITLVFLRSSLSLATIYRNHVLGLSHLRREYRVMSAKSTVLFLNPPGATRVIRDTFCGMPAKGRYLWPNLDLLVLSGFVDESAFELVVIDAMVEEMSSAETLRRATECRPKLVVSATSAITWTADMEFLSQLKARTNATILVTGDYPTGAPEAALRDHADLDGVILDYSDCDLLTVATSGPEAGLRNIFTRLDAAPTKAPGRKFDMPVPRHELFPLHRYHLPQGMYHPVTLLATDFGCAYSCSFCVCERFSYKRRTLDNLSAELDKIRSLGIREFRIMDVIFGTVKSHALAVCDALASFDPPFSWSCEMRCDAIDEELLVRMKQVGCHTIMMGVESASDEILEKHRKGIKRADVERAFALARKVGLRTVGYFIIGLPGDTYETIDRTIQFAIDLDPDFASFSAATPTWNTSMRDEIVENGWLTASGVETVAKDFDPLWKPPVVSREDLTRLRGQAMRRFYLRPGFIVRHLRSIRTRYQLSNFVRESVGMLGEFLWPRPIDDSPLVPPPAEPVPASAPTVVPIEVLTANAKEPAVKG